MDDGFSLAPFSGFLPLSRFLPLPLSPFFGRLSSFLLSPGAAGCFLSGGATPARGTSRKVIFGGGRRSLSPSVPDPVLSRAGVGSSRARAGLASVVLITGGGSAPTRWTGDQMLSAP